MNDVNAIARAAYSDGTDPIDWAVELVRIQMETQVEVIASRLDNPDAYPSYLLALDDKSVARRIIGELLDAGWTPPEVVTEW